MVDTTTRALLDDVRRDIEDAAEQISQAVQKVESGEVPSSEGCSARRCLKLLGQRIDQQLEARN